MLEHSIGFEPGELVRLRRDSTRFNRTVRKGSIGIVIDGMVHANQIPTRNTVWYLILFSEHFGRHFAQRDLEAL
jgi:hypothetical protein